MALPQVGVEAVVANLSKFQSATKTVNQSLGSIDKTVGTTVSSFSGFGASIISSVGGAALSAISSLTKHVIGLGIAFAQSAVKEGMAFTKEMSNVIAVSNAGVTQIPMLTDTMERLGRTTKFTATEAAQGAGFLAMAGFEVTEIMSALPGVLNLASAANLDLGKSADIVSNILTGYGGTAEETGRFVDILTKAFTTSNTNLEQLGAAMKFVGPTANSLGQEIEVTTAAIAALSDAGIQGALAGTSLRSIMLSLASPTSIATKEMQQLGLFTGLTDQQFQATQKSASDVAAKIAEVDTSFDERQLVIYQQELAGINTKYGEGSIQAEKKQLAIDELSASIDEQKGKLSDLVVQQDALSTSLENGQSAFFYAAGTMKEVDGVMQDVGGTMKPMPDVIEALADATANLSDEERTAAIKRIVGVRQFSALQVLIEKGPDAMRAYADELRNSTGTAARVAQTQLDNLSGSVTIFQSALSGIKVDAFQAMAPLLKGVVDKATEYLSFLGDKFREFQDIFAAGGLFGKRSGSFGSIGLLAALGIPPNIVDTIQTIFTKVTDAFTAFRAGVGLFDVTGKIGGKSVTFDGILSILGIPPEYQQIIGNILGSFNDAVAGFKTGGIGGAFSALLNSENIQAAISNIGSLIGSAISSLWTTYISPTIQGWAIMFWDWASVVIANAPTTLANIGISISEAVAELWNTYIAPNIDGWKDLFWNWVGQAATNAPGQLTAIVTAINTWLTAQWPIIEAQLLIWRDNFWTWAKDVASNAGVALAAIGIAILAWAQSPELQQQLSDLGQNLGKTLIDSLGRSAEDQQSILQIVLGIVSGLGVAVLGITGALITLGGQFVAGLIAGILESLGIDLEPAMVSELGAIISGIWSSIVTIAKELGTRIIEDGLTLAVVSAIDDIFPNKFTGAFRRVLSAVGGDVTSISELVDMGLGIVSSIIDAAKVAIEETVDDIMDLGKSIVDGIKKGIDENASQVFEVIKSMVQDAIQGAKDLLGIGSPSKVFEDMGEDTILGFIRGVDNKKNSLATTMQEFLAGPMKELRNGLNDWVTQAAKNGGLNDIKDEKVIDDIQRTVTRNADKLALGVTALNDANNLNRDTLEALILNSTEVAPKVARDLADSMFKSNGEMKKVLLDLIAGNGELLEAIKEARRAFNLAQLGLGSSILGLGTTALDRFVTEAQRAAAKINSEFGEIELNGFDTRKLEIYRDELTAIIAKHGQESTQARNKQLQIDKLMEKMTDEPDMPIVDAFREIHQLILKKINPTLGEWTQEDEARYTLLKTLGMDAVNQNATEYERILQAARELNKAEEERVLLAQKQADLQFLQQQLGLMSMLRDFGLDPSQIFAGITFGLDASLADLIEATRRATDAIINQVNDDLEIASPSKVMARAGEQIMKGLQVGMDRVGVDVPLPGSRNSSVTNNYNFGMNVNTGAAAQSVIGQYSVMKALVQ